MVNPVVGACACPLCAEEGAEVRQGAKGALYIVCDACVSQVRTMSRAGRVAIQKRASIQLAPAAPVAQPEDKPIVPAAVPPVAKPKKGATTWLGI